MHLKDRIFLSAICHFPGPPNKYPRSKGFIPMDKYLQHVKADVIFAMFGFNESFDGPNNANNHKNLLVDFVGKLRSYQPNGKSFPRIVLFSPIAFQNLKDRNLPNGRAHNRNLAAYTKATENAAKEAGVQFIDLFNPTLKLFEQSKEPLTINGAHLNAEGNRLLAEIIAKALLGKDIKANDGCSKSRKRFIKRIGLGITATGLRMEMTFGEAGRDYDLLMINPMQKSSSMNLPCLM